jgi:hypothetical protein
MDITTRDKRIETPETRREDLPQRPARIPAATEPTPEKPAPEPPK